MKKASLLFLVLSLALIASINAAAHNIYSNGKLEAGFENWSWGTNSLTSNVKTRGGHSASWSKVLNNFEGLYPHGNLQVTSENIQFFSFWISGDGTSGQSGSSVTIQFYGSSGVIGSQLALSALGASLGNSWQLVNTTMAPFNIPSGSALTGLVFQAQTAGTLGTIYIDDISYISVPPPPLTITINPNGPSKAVSNLIYGTNFANSTNLYEVRYPLNRWGGNSATRYNWKIDVSNKANDWFYENIAETVPDVSALPRGTSSDKFIDDTRAGNAKVVITVPIIGWTPANRTNKVCGFSVKKYGPQDATDQWAPDCGNGLRNKVPITGNDPRDTSMAVGPQFAVEWLDYLINTRMIIPDVVQLDNEPCLWGSSHRDIHPQQLTYDELWNKTVQYASAIKKRFPRLRIAGPMFWGWCAIMFSPSDPDGCRLGSDRQKHGDTPFLQWYINQIADYKAKNKVQLIDIIDFHWYPQASGVALSNNEDSATAALRLRSTRTLWDTTYTDESWQAAPTYILPRIQGWINAVSNSVKLTMSISEYNWGNDGLISGALAQVDVLGIFGLYGVEMAMRWVTPARGSVAELAMKLFTNYNGLGDGIKGRALNATSTNIASVAAYAYTGTARYLFVVLVNKNTASVTPTVTTGLPYTGSIVSHSFSQASMTTMTKSTTTQVTSGTFTPTLPAYSATLFLVNKKR